MAGIPAGWLSVPLLLKIFISIPRKTFLCVMRVLCVTLPFN